VELRSVAAFIGMQGVFEDPNNPKKDGTHSPQVPLVDEHGKRFNEAQSGAVEQLT
jgi:hypothetical protein